MLAGVHEGEAHAVLAIVFGDIAGSTRTLEKLGESRYSRLYDDHERTVRGVLQPDGRGQVVQTYGDGFLAVFREPSLAVERCLQLQATLGPDHPLPLRIGIDLGQVSVRGTWGAVQQVRGRHVHRAARVQDHAEPGGVVVTHAVYDAAAGWLQASEIGWRAQGEVALKGFRQPVTLHEVAVPLSSEPIGRAGSHLRLVSAQVA